jgi:HAD superfamily phosphatase
MSERFIVFDIDGVLVNVSDSYRATIIQTVEDFTGKRISRELIQEFKNQGGWNDDWDLSYRIVTDLGGKAEFDDVVRHFNKLFFGNGSDGLILRERWIALPGVLERLAGRYRLAIYTGRRQYEVEPTLARFGGAVRFDPIVTAEMVQRLKPAPDGLLQIREMHAGEDFRYVGDTIDDCRCANAAGVPFIGISAPDNPRSEELACLFKAEGAIAVLDDINQLETVL